jgi:hypothetical protein
MDGRSVPSPMSDSDFPRQAVQEALDRRDNGGETGH